jgi:hypothetical protein
MALNLKNINWEYEFSTALLLRWFEVFKPANQRNIPED